MANLVLIDPIEPSREALRDLLEADGHDVQTFANLQTAWSAATGDSADLILSDIALPGIDGVTVLRRLQAMTDAPVVLLATAPSPAQEAKVLRLGADDYFARPMDNAVLCARVGARLRSRVNLPHEGQESTILERGQLRLDRLRHQVRWDGHEVLLTPTEFNVLWSIAQRPGQVLSRATILDAAYGNDAFVTDRSIDSQVKRIRMKLRQVAPEFCEIQTLYGLGYRYTNSSEVRAA